jgi:ribosomal protein S18 acetylase RimI-like enzyme
MTDATTLRWAMPTDLEALYDVCVRTGDAGHDATGLLHDGQLYGHLYAAQYLHFQPECALVAEIDGAVAGYALGAVDTAGFEARLEAGWWPPLRARYPLPGDGTELDRRLIAQLHRPTLTPTELTTRYPSHLHIDLLPVLQGRGLGRAMIQMLLDRLQELGSRGVHLGVDPRNQRAIGFYEHLGFTRHQDPRVVLFTRRL